MSGRRIITVFLLILILFGFGGMSSADNVQIDPGTVSRIDAEQIALGMDYLIENGYSLTDQGFYWKGAKDEDEYKVACYIFLTVQNNAANERASSDEPETYTFIGYSDAKNCYLSTFGYISNSLSFNMYGQCSIESYKPIEDEINRIMDIVTHSTGDDSTERVA